MSEFSPDEVLDAAIAHHEAGRLHEAEPLYRQILLRDPDDPEVNYLLGLVLGQSGRFAPAVELIHKALRFMPPDADVCNNLGEFYRHLQDSGSAITAFRNALALNPKHAQAMNNLGIVLLDRGDLPEAVALFEQAIAIHPALIESYNNLGKARLEQNRLDDATALFEKAIAINPRHVESYNHLGMTRWTQNRLDEALQLYRQAIAIDPTVPQSYCNIGVALRSKGLMNEAIAAFRQSVAVKPDYVDGHMALAGALLTQGDFQQGLQEYEWRARLPDFAPNRVRQIEKRWDGSPLNGRTILLHAEQGLGDAVQFARYATHVARLGGRVILACPRMLIDLLKNIEGVSQAVDYHAPLPPFDLYAPLLSLPHLLGTRLESIPAKVPYLFSRPEEIERCRQELSGLSGVSGFKVGIAWQGNPKNKGDFRRSIPLAMFEPLARIPGVTLVSLQKDTGAEQIASLAGRFPIITPGDRVNSIGPFSGTPALMRNLDLVISIDSVVCHLAGAMAVPVWTLVPFVPDWRWLENRDDSPWYPTMRLFRQTALADWPSVIHHVSKALAAIAHQKPPP